MKSTEVSDNVTAKGHCLLACATFQDTLGPGRGLIPWSILYRVPIHPKTIGSGRLKEFSTLFQNYKFKKIRIEYIPEINSLTNGDVAVWFSQNMDTVFPTVDGFALRSYLEECEDATSSHVWDPMMMDYLKEKSTHEVYFCERTNMDLAGTYQTCVNIATSHVNTAEAYLGDFVIHYEIEFSGARAPADTFDRNSVGGLSMPINASIVGAPASFDTNDNDVVNFWKQRTGLYYCTVQKGCAAGTSFSNINGLSGRAGDMFYLEVEFHPTEAGFFAANTIRFILYANSAAVLQGQPMYFTSLTNVLSTMYFVGTFILNAQQQTRVLPVQGVENNSYPMIRNERDKENSASSVNRGQPLGIHVIEHESGNFDPHVVVNPFTGNVTCSNPKWR